MFSRLRRRRERAERIEARATALVRGFGVDAYSEARQRERQADCDATAREWSRVALAVARKTGERVGLDTSRRMAKNADFSSNWEAGKPSGDAITSEPRAFEELRRLISRR
jgi:hypothetical protein